MTGIRFIVPFGRDGAADRAARAFARALCLGRGCVIENLPGSGGLPGVQRANELAAAGEPVLLLGTPTTHILLPARLGDTAAPGDSFQPLLGLGSAPNVLLVSSGLGVRSVRELIAKAKRERASRLRLRRHGTDDPRLHSALLPAGRHSNDAQAL